MSLNPVSFITPTIPGSAFPRTLSPRCRSASGLSSSKPSGFKCCSTRSEEASNVPLLELRNVHFRVPKDYDRILFEDMNFRMYPNEFVVMIGPNGSGKSTSKFERFQCDFL